MSSLWDAVVIQVPDCTGPLMPNLSGTPDTMPEMARSTTRKKIRIDIGTGLERANWTEKEPFAGTD
jgi:hypothetical protein